MFTNLSLAHLHASVSVICSAVCAVTGGKLCVCVCVCVILEVAVGNLSVTPLSLEADPATIIKKYKRPRLRRRCVCRQSERRTAGKHSAIGRGGRRIQRVRNAAQSNGDVGRQ